MKILITGASGFIGSYLVEKALEKNWDVTAAVRKTSDKTYLQDKRIRFLELDFGNEQQLTEKLKQTGGFDYVIHNAGATKVLNAADYFYTNTEHTERFVRALAYIPPRKFVFVSSLAALGPANPNSIIRADDIPHPISAYGESKLEAENFLEKACPFPYIVVQPAGVYGPRDKDLFTVFQILARGIDVQLGSEAQKISLIHAQDLTEAIYTVMEFGTDSKKYIINDGTNYLSSDLSDAIKKAFNKKAVKINIPLSVVRLIANVSEKIGKLRNKTTMIYPERIEMSISNWHTEKPAIFSELNFKPHFDLYTGIKQTADWYKKEKWI